MGTDGTNNRQIYTNSSTDPNAIAFNPTTDTIYWIEHTDSNGNGRIMRANPDGTGVTLVVGGRLNPRGLALDPVGAGTLYWREDSCLCQTRTTGIFSWNLNTAQFRTIASNIPSAGETGLALDAERGKVYWSESSSIRRSNTDGTAPETVISNVGSRFGIAH